MTQGPPFESSRKVLKPRLISQEDASDTEGSTSTAASSPVDSIPVVVVAAPREGEMTHRVRRTAATPHPPASSSQAPKQPESERKALPANEETIQSAQNATTTSTIKYTFDMFSNAARLLRLPLCIVLALLLFAMMLELDYISTPSRVTLAPLCPLPGARRLRICRPQLDPGQSPDWADYPSLVGVQSTTFGYLLEESIAGSGMSLEIKKAEVAGAELAFVVRTSGLMAKDTLGNVLSEFVTDAKKTGYRLQEFSSKVSGAVDKIMAVNNYALHKIEGARAKNSPSLSNMFGMIPWTSEHVISGIIAKTFGEAMHVLSITIEHLILEAENNIANLNKLEESLATLQEIVHRERSSEKARNARVVPFFGFAALLVDSLDGGARLAILNDVGTYRQKALAHVIAALQVLQSMSTDLEDIRRRAAAPELTDFKIPVEVHIESIKSGLERLREGRVRAKRLEAEAIRKALGH